MIYKHEISNSKFVTCGDDYILDFIAYVAMDGVGGRACYVIECDGGLAQWLWLPQWARLLSKGLRRFRRKLKTDFYN